MKKVVFIFAFSFVNNINAQTYQWAKGIGNPTLITNAFNFGNYAQSVTSDLAGNSYITGNFAGSNIDFNPGLGPITLTSGPNPDIFFAKYAAGGNCIWAKSLVGSYGTGESIITDPNGNVYITGAFSGAFADFDPGPGVVTLNGSGNDIFFAKYDANGNYLWANVIGVGVNQDGTGKSISLDATGNIYVTGLFGVANVDFDPGPGIATLNSVGNGDIFLAKYNSNGNYLWAKSIGGAQNDYGECVSIDASGNVYITGYFSGVNTDFDPGPGTAYLTSAGSSDIFFAKYDTNGNYVWAKSILGAGSNFADIGYSINVDAVGNIYLTGIFYGISVDFDPGPGVGLLNAGTQPNFAMFFAHYDNNGNYIWAKSIMNAEGTCIKRSSLGDVYVTGIFNGSSVDFDPGPGMATLSGGYEPFFAKYDVAGNYVWAKSIPGSIGPFNLDYRPSITVDGSDNVYIAGKFIGYNVDFDIGPGTATLTSLGAKMYLAKYAYCSAQITNTQVVCPGTCYAINGHCYNTNGTYNDTLYSAFGCDSIVVTQLTVSGQALNLTISSNSILCSGSSNTLTASGASTYTWSTGAQNPVLVVTPTNVTQYVVTGSSGSCSGSAVINVIPSPMLVISGTQTICAGEQVVITASGASSYTWDTGEQTQSVSVSPNLTTVYAVTGSSPNSACKSYQTYAVNAMPCLGIHSNYQGEIQAVVYPNPAKTELFYTVNSTGVHRYSLTDASGRVLVEGEQWGTKVCLDVSCFRPGLYILTINVGKASKSSRFFIE